MEFNDEVVDKGPPWWKSMRFKITIIGFLGGANLYIQRSNMSMAIVCMVNHTAVDLLYRADLDIISSNTTMNVWSQIFQQDRNLSDVAPLKDACQSTLSPMADSGEGDLVWSKEIQGLILGGLYWGYVPSQLISGLILKRYGIRRTVGPLFLAMSLLTILTHSAAIWSPWAVFTLRVLIGILNGVTMPGLFFIIAAWAPPDGNGRLSSLIIGGLMMGNVVVFPVASLLCRYGFAGGWPSIFHVSGISGFLFCLLWFIWVYDTPIKHPSINLKEKAFIMSNMDVFNVSPDTVNVFFLWEINSLPWCKVLRTVPYIALIVTHTCFNWGLYLILNNLPLYMREVLKFQLASNGVWTMIPYSSMFAFIMLAGIMLDKMSHHFGHHISRKSSVSVGLGISAILLIIISYLECDDYITVIILMCLTLSLLALAYLAIMVNFFDIDPQHAGQLMTFSNTIANIPGILVSYAVGEYTKDNTREQWQKVFFLSSGILGFGALIFVIFGSVYIPKWARTSPREKGVRSFKF
ncbi:hypothetical protein LOTGIDRAFT_161346 [Lottia gigantea]|uniref:Major facilitator superfamily (MFS) profile domain-containing protein n=1 Tax=Lottia gigantea TaxID=225164 RepID=V4AKP9_LOTGI|nr:hypothetical protein LOTGIDRAFT_161346 [Lottia gigantea]ESO94146.1 hypothetical protein LOTGIDRAFT_161346 [Lottia gigantea]